MDLYQEQSEEPEVEDPPYCRTCGLEELACLGNYANGTEWKCTNCGDEFIY